MFGSTLCVKVMSLECVLINRCLYTDTLSRTVLPERIYLNFNLRAIASTDVMRKEQEHLVEYVTCVPKVNHQIVLEVIKFYLLLIRRLV
jgi:hypothetical protein